MSYRGFDFNNIENEKYQYDDPTQNDLNKFYSNLTQYDNNDNESNYYSDYKSDHSKNDFVDISKMYQNNKYLGKNFIDAQGEYLGIDNKNREKYEGNTIQQLNTNKKEKNIESNEEDLGSLMTSGIYDPSKNISCAYSTNSAFNYFIGNSHELNDIVLNHISKCCICKNNVQYQINNYYKNKNAIKQTTKNVITDIPTQTNEKTIKFNVKSDDIIPSKILNTDFYGHSVKELAMMIIIGILIILFLDVIVSFIKKV